MKLKTVCLKSLPMPNVSLASESVTLESAFPGSFREMLDFEYHSRPMKLQPAF